MPDVFLQRFFLRAVRIAIPEEELELTLQVLHFYGH
jgi:hypothetical protein